VSGGSRVVGGITTVVGLLNDSCTNALQGDPPDTAIGRAAVHETGVGAGALGGAGVGSVFGPAGIFLGALVGGLFGDKVGTGVGNLKFGLTPAEQAEQDRLAKAWADDPKKAWEDMQLAQRRGPFEGTGWADYVRGARLDESTRAAVVGQIQDDAAQRQAEQDALTSFRQEEHSPTPPDSVDTGGGFEWSPPQPSDQTDSSAGDAQLVE